MQAYKIGSKAITGDSLVIGSTSLSLSNCTYIHKHWDLFCCLEKLEEIFNLEKDNHIHVNMSTGSKINHYGGNACTHRLRYTGKLREQKRSCALYGIYATLNTRENPKPVRSASYDQTAAWRIKTRMETPGMGRRTWWRGINRSHCVGLIAEKLARI